MAVENIEALSDEVIERRALEVLERAAAKRRQLSTDCAYIKADQRVAHALLVGWNVENERVVDRQFLEEGTEGEICARYAMGRVLRHLANSTLDAELATILILLAGHFDGKTGYRTVLNAGPHKSKLPPHKLIAERRLKFERRAPVDTRSRYSLAWIKKAWLQFRSMFQRLT